METKVVRPRHPSYDANKKRQGIKSTFFYPRPLEKRCLDAAGLKEMSKKLRQCKPNIPYAKMISSSVVNIKVTKTIVGIVEKGSLLEVHLKHHEVQNLSKKFNYRLLFCIFWLVDFPLGLF